MIKSLIVENYVGDEITITLTDANPDHGLLIWSMTGLGPPKATINTSDYAAIDGSKFNSARAEKRNIVLELKFATTDGCDMIETARMNTYKYFPLKRQVTLTFETDKKLCQIKGHVESNEPGIFSKEEGCQISIICDAPYFYEVGENSPRIINFSDVVPLFEFPFENNSLDENLIEFSKYETNKEKLINYEGTVETGMVIRVHVLDTVGSLTIYNFVTKEWMYIDNSKIAALTGSGLKAKDDLVISTIENDQYINLVREGTITNVLNAVNRQSDWFLLRPGDNVLAFTTDDDTDDNLEFSVEFRVLYEGI